MIILKELISEGYIHNRHIAMLFDESKIGSFDDLEIKNISFSKVEPSANERQQNQSAAPSQKQSQANNNNGRQGAA